MDVVKKLHSSVICKHLDCSEPLHQTLIKTVCGGIGALLLKEQPFQKSSSTITLEFLPAGRIFGQTSLSQCAREGFSQGGLEAVVELAEEKELGMV